MGRGVVAVVKAQRIRPQYWRVTLACRHQQEVHSVRHTGPLFVLRCQTCDPGNARRRRTDREAR